jgi:hypothetical protein
VDLGIYLVIVLKCVRKIGWESVDRIEVSEYRMWWAVVLKIMNLSGASKREEVPE